MSFLSLLPYSPSVLQACEAAEYLTKLPDRIRKLSERAAARKQRTKGAKANFAWVFDRPVELV
jgi:acyl-[acyl-carrier-protein] desaturase